jgi:hypothetical protein
MIIVVPTFYQSSVEVKRFKVTEVMYKSLCGEYVVKIDDPSGEEPEPYKIVDGIKFKWWKYKDWTDEWRLIKGELI